MAADLLVVGLDLVTGREVHAGERRTEEWRKKGNNGDRTLVCLACYEGADLPGGPRAVALVPKGREGGARQQHFAHPPGIVPPGGRHSPESLSHAESKQALREWADAQGFTARVEAWAPDGRRRSDVEVVMPDGQRLAIELQRGELSDAEWIARHEDYARAGITDLWLYHPDTRVPRVVFRHRQPGWRFDLKTGTIGLIHAQPSPADAWTSPHPTQCRAVHWPPCPADQLATKWMPLASARLTPGGIEPSTQTTAELDQTRGHRRPRTRRGAGPISGGRPRPRRTESRRRSAVHCREGRCAHRWRSVAGDARGIPLGPVPAGGGSGYLVLWLQ